MTLKISKDLIEAMEKNKRLALDKEKSSESRLIINMGKKTDKGFKVPTDFELDSNRTDNFSLEEIIKYVREHTSEKKNHYDLAEGGLIMVTFPEFVRMVNDGYNIYKSEVLNENFISIQYQREIKREGRGR